MGKKEKAIIIKASERHMELDENFENTIENRQKLVGGYVELFQLRYDDKTKRSIDMWLNEDGKLEGLQDNIVIVDNKHQEIVDVIVGDVVIMASNTLGNTVGLLEEEVDYVQKMIKPGLKEGSTMKILRL